MVKAVETRHAASPPLLTTTPSPSHPAQFPTPAPLSQQDVLLAQLAQHADPRALQALAAATAAPMQPLEIPPLEIAPLQPAPEEPAAATPPRPQEKSLPQER